MRANCYYWNSRGQQGRIGITQKQTEKKYKRAQRRWNTNKKCLHIRMGRNIMEETKSVK